MSCVGSGANVIVFVFVGGRRGLERAGLLKKVHGSEGDVGGAVERIAGPGDYCNSNAADGIERRQPGGVTFMVIAPIYPFQIALAT